MKTIIVEKIPKKYKKLFDLSDSEFNDILLKDFNFFKNKRYLVCSKKALYSVIWSQIGNIGIKLGKKFEGSILNQELRNNIKRDFIFEAKKNFNFK